MSGTSSSLPADLFSIFTRPLVAAGIRHAVTGSVAGMAYGEPRFTNDIDIVVELAVDQVGAFVAAFPIADFYCPPDEVIVVEVRRRQRGHFNVIHHDSGFKADLYPVGDDGLQRWAIDGARTVDVDGAPMRLAPPEYVIVKKLEFHREGGSAKHLTDIAGIIHGVGDALDRATIERHCARLGLGAAWAAALASADGG
jgi:hypothetical protein